MSRFQTGAGWMRIPCPIPTGKGKVLPKCRKLKRSFVFSRKYQLTQKKKFHDKSHLKYVT